MKYERYDDCLKAPNGRTIRNLRKDAKAQHKATGLPLNRCLNDLAKSYGFQNGWEAFHASLINQAVSRVDCAPCQMTQADLNQILDAHSDLTQWGFRAMRRPYDDRAYAEILRDENDILRSCLVQCNRALVFLNLFKPQRTVNRNPDWSTYELKHVGERVFRFLGSEESGYVCHGSFLAAAIFKGYLIERNHKGGSVYFMNLDENSPILLWDGCKDTSVYRDLLNELSLYHQFKNNDPFHQACIAYQAAR